MLTRENPYGKHFVPQPGTVEKRLKGKVDIEEKNFCPYYTNRIEIDRVVYILSKTSGLKISYGLAEHMLNDYKMASGWRYRGTTLENIPWTFAYMSSAHTLFGRVLTDETLLSELCAKQPDLIVEDGKISVKPSQFCALSFCFIFHKQEFIDEMLKESIDFVISDRDRKTVCQKTIHFDDTYLTNIITSEKSNNYRNPRLIELARSILGD